MQSSSGDIGIENRLVDLAWGRRGGEGGMCGENNMENYITIYKIDTQWEFAVLLSELKRALKQPRKMGWGGRAEGCPSGRGHR